MFIGKMKEIAATGRLTTIVRIAFVALALVSALLFGNDVFAGPIPGGIGG